MNMSSECRCRSTCSRTKRMHKEFMYHFELCWHAHPSQHNKSRSEHKLWWHFWDAAATPMRGGGGNEDNDNSNNKHMAEYSNAIVSSRSSCCCCCLEPEDSNHLIIVVHFAERPSLHSNHYFRVLSTSNVIEISQVQSAAPSLVLRHGKSRFLRLSSSH